jgi:hypothetical protein
MSEQEIQDVLDQLSILEPTSLDAPKPASTALAQLRPKIGQAEEDRAPSWWQRLFLPAPARRWAFAAAVLLILAFSFTFPSVRAAASEFLGLFRVEKFAAISISPEQIALLDKLAREGLNPGEIHISQEPGAETPVDSLSEAGAIAGLVPRTLPNFGSPESIKVIDGGSGRFVIDLAGARAIMEATGNDPMLLPDSIDGSHISIVAFPSIEQAWQDENIWLIQTTTPLVEYPEDIVDQTVLAEAFLQVLGLDAAEAQRLARDIDWTSTLLLPLPSDLVTYQEITVDDVSGMALQDIDSVNSAIIWEKEGIIYLLQGKRSPADLQALAASME